MGKKTIVIFLGRTLVVVAPPRSVGGARACVAVGAATPDPKADYLPTSSPSLLQVLPGIALLLGPTLLLGWLGYTYWGFWGMQAGTLIGVTTTITVLPLMMSGSDLP